MIDRITTPQIMMKFHLALTGVWILLIIPTMLWWSTSILWILLISLYANIIGHFSAWQAVRAEMAIKEKDA